MRVKAGDKPQGLPYPIDRVKEFLRVTGTDQDGVIAKLIAAAADVIETNTWVVFGSRTYTGYMDTFNNEDNIIPKHPITAVTSVTYYDTNNSQQTLATSGYWYDINTDIARIYFDNAPNVYDDRFSSVEVNFTAGYTNWYDIPDEYVQLLMLIVSEFYEARTFNVVGASVAEFQTPVIKHLMNSLSKRTFV